MEVWFKHGNWEDPKVPERSLRLEVSRVASGLGVVTPVKFRIKLPGQFSFCPDVQWRFSDQGYVQENFFSSQGKACIAERIKVTNWNRVVHTGGSRPAED